MNNTRRTRHTSLIDPCKPDIDASPATRPATSEQRYAALGTAIILGVSTVILLPYAQIQWPLIPSFLPTYQTAIIGTYLITAYLMFGQYKATRSASLLYLCAGCLYTAGVLIAQFLSFPNAFIPKETLLGGGQTTIWLWAFWHAGPAVGILIYSWAEYRQPGRLTRNHMLSMSLTAGVLALVLVATIATVTAFRAWLPVLDVNGDYSRASSTGVAPVLQVTLMVALILLWKGSRFRTVLHVWLGIALFALLCDNAITMTGANRFSLGWYVGRFNALISSSVMMYVYMQEIKRSYVRTAAVAERLITSNVALATSKAKLEVQVDEARLDTLTRLPLRELFMERGEAMRVASMAAGNGFATLFIDLDDFKAINDRFGHDHGDIVLIRVADALRSVLREEDVACRLGGDEFVACLSASQNEMLPIATRISERIVEKIWKLGDGIGASVGISICETNLELAIRQADEAMYEAKKQGKNHYTLFRPKPQLVQRP
jgi:diguanylate cyclase (GGDEF)-like protein